uniref:Fibronectin type-III domain-containing protein n=1 Tax=Amphimedon queenslandica TaxID=400682 RepID=A0A1X7UK33_AMPQE
VHQESSLTVLYLFVLVVNTRQYKTHHISTVIMEIILSFLSFMLLFNHLDGTPQFTTCPSSVCLSQPVTYECNSGADTLAWIVLDTNGDRVGSPVAYTVFNNVGDTGSIGGQFITVLTVGGSSLVSNITFTPTLNMNNYTVQCGAVGTLVNCSIVIANIPSAPIPSSITFYSDSLTFPWSPSNSSCLSHYNVNVTSIEYTISTNDTSLSLPVPSTNDTEHSISVVAVDTGGRYMDPVDQRTFVADVPEFVTNIQLNQTDLSIDVSWEEPPALMFLPVLSYIIYPNVTDLNNNITIPAPTTTYNIPDATLGSVYTVGVAASNVLGIDTTDFASATIMIISTAMTEMFSSTISFPAISTSSLTSAGTVSNSVPSATSSTLMSTTIMSPSSSNNVPATGGSNSTVYIGIGAGVALIAIVILILIIVGCMVWRKPWKRDK